MDLLTQNKIADAKEYLATVGKPLVDADLVEVGSYGIDLALAADFFVGTYEGDNAFVLDLKSKMTNRPLTQPQRRGALNVWLKDLNPEALKPAAQSIKCFSCQAEFKTWDELYSHKEDEHGAEARPGPVTETDHGVAEGVAVIADTSATRGLDLSNLPDGCYAVPNMSKKYMNDNQNVWLWVKRIHRTHRRDRRFRYGKVVTGDELVVQGTIEVKIWSSDAKELIGEQKPGDVYRGELEDELELCMSAPEIFARLFGRLVQRCCICRKALTDDESKAIGMGLDCEKKVAYFTTKPQGFEPWCPTCEEGDGTKSLGHIAGFNYAEGLTKYKCYFGHMWRVAKDGTIRVENHQH